MFTVEYTTTGAIGYTVKLVTNRYGLFATKAEAEAWLKRNPVRDGKIVPAHK